MNSLISSLISSLALYKSLKLLQIFKELLSRDHDWQNLVRHVKEMSRSIQNCYMYLELDELFVA